MLAKIHITLKKDVLDPQGKVVANSLNTLGFETVQDVRQGKYIEVTIDEEDTDIAKQKLLFCNICIFFVNCYFYIFSLANILNSFKS